MAVKAFSSEWAKAFKDEVNKSSIYKTAGRGWKWTVGLVVEAEPANHFPEAKGIVMDLFDGEARHQGRRRVRCAEVRLRDHSAVHAVERGRHQPARRHQGDAPGQAQAEG